MKKSGITMTVDKLKSVLAGLALLPKTDVLVGIPEDRTERKASNEPTNAMIGYVQEMGSPAQNIPARPFLAEGIRDAKGDITRQMANAGKQALKGNKQGVIKSMHAAGLRAQFSVKNKLQEGPWTPLKPGTLAARRRRGRTGTRPLVDTGQLRNSINYVVRTK